MAPLPISLTTCHLNLLHPHATCITYARSTQKSLYTQAPLIIGVVVGVVASLLLLFASWWYGCLCCWSRKTARKKKDGYKTVGQGKINGTGPPIFVGPVVVDTEVGENYDSGGSGIMMDIGADGSDVSGDGGGSGDGTVLSLLGRIFSGSGGSGDSDSADFGGGGDCIVM
ncbi:hypothetical protein CC78DRAFT_543849 [Lojkania enalia]|uniref:Uncharacterized protein n=1 Tax=Lojkania enalia TaxID=147567 RepID=A0A9P4KBP0_9PLEO|nr:hypothetical protein CC78DRAFT_543849 [Didymosphaeria enalia]